MKEIRTKFKTPLRAAHDIADKVNRDSFVKEMGDKAVVIEDFDEGYPAVCFDFAFEAALGFTNGQGLYGYEGYGSCGPVFDQENSEVWLECYDSVTVGVFKK